MSVTMSGTQVHPRTSVIPDAKAALCPGRFHAGHHLQIIVKQIPPFLLLPCLQGRVENETANALHDSSSILLKQLMLLHQ